MHSQAIQKEKVLVILDGDLFYAYIWLSVPTWNTTTGDRLVHDIISYQEKGLQLEGEELGESEGKIKETKEESYPFHTPPKNMSIEDLISGQHFTLLQQLETVNHSQSSVHLSSLHIDLH